MTAPLRDRKKFPWELKPGLRACAEHASDLGKNDQSDKANDALCW
jgi:hypothetical protein